jgi:hypothetical protein
MVMKKQFTTVFFRPTVKSKTKERGDLRDGAFLECGREVRHERSYRFRRPGGRRMLEGTRRRTLLGTRKLHDSRPPRDVRKRQLHSFLVAQPQSKSAPRAAALISERR